MSSTRKKTDPKKPRPAIQVVARPDSFFRAGRQFTQEPTVIALEDLTDEQEKAIRSEPKLVVTDTELPPLDAEADKA